METDEICQLPIEDICDKDCVLFLWVVYSKLEDAFEVINKWGFRYSTVAFEWIKLTTPYTLKPVQFMGVNVVGGAIELCLLARKGNLKRINKKVRRAIWDSRREHSKKPDEARKRIVQLFGDLPRIELFAREKKNGFDVWGNEVKSDIELKPNQ